MVVGTTEAAFLLNISTARVRVLLKEGRIKGANKKGRSWLIPLNSQGIPEIIPGSRGPDGTWNKGQRTSKTVIQILPTVINANHQNGTCLPAINIQQGDRHHLCHEADILGPCKIIYQPSQGNSGPTGETNLWIEINPEVQIIHRVFSDVDENLQKGSRE
ncbi:MAG: helix-turn-helix domain-containing protein [Okeania sp. SIO3B5]|uniref:helix-turn-helix domain-containing protein n=1 Tax=Okeania sp. SIO3B5 TaxID=2607811 RepID=UPI0013FECC03|nr:helix-turn-helix domain-containing protein [Okeania sp. SIO3B5]NEO56751.1 helix-turn-helix domain-containing protein [Okeania sp. SIO3B5]